MRKRRVLLMVHKTLVPPDDVSGMSAADVDEFRAELLQDFTPAQIDGAVACTLAAMRNADRDPVRVLQNHPDRSKLNTGG